jgi:hypothetical protein
VKEYIIEYEKEHRTHVYECLEQFHPYVFSEIPFMTVSVDEAKEKSLLEVLASVPHITYRQALTRKQLDL